MAAKVSGAASSRHADLPEGHDQIASLDSRGIPVIVSTGNAYLDDKIGFPACVNDVIRVGSVWNDGVATKRSSFSNIARAANFSSGTFLMAPGGSSTTAPAGKLPDSKKTVVQSAVVSSGIATSGLAGTSQAAPHVAGLYAAVKAASPGATVADVTTYLRQNASIEVTFTWTGGSEKYKRVKLPAF